MSSVSESRKRIGIGLTHLTVALVFTVGLTAGNIQPANAHSPFLCWDGVTPTYDLKLCPPEPKRSLPYEWHDGTKGGLYGIGDDWSIELSPARYGHETRTYLSGEQAQQQAHKLIPAEYDWVKDETENLSGPSEMKTVFVIVPAEYATLTETVVTEEAKTEYYFQDAKYGSGGHVLKPKTIGLRHIPAVTNTLTRRVVKIPEKLEERQVPLERKRGFRRMLNTPQKVVSVPADVKGTSVTVLVQKQPWKFMMKNPKGQIVHSFDDFNDLTAFMDTVKKE